MDKPNVVLPLAISYNERGLLGDTNIQSGLDQRKVNCIYEPISNAMTGKTTLYVTKRPGVENSGFFFGDSGQITTLLQRAPNSTGNELPWLFSVTTVPSVSSVIRVSNGGATVTITTIATSLVYPKYSDRTAINGVDTVVVQVGSTAGEALISTFYASSIGTWTNISHSSFAALSQIGKMEHMDGFAFQMTTTNRIHNSNINTVSTWPEENFITKQIKQDVARGLARLNNQILSFGSETVEVFYNGGISPSPLLPIKQLAQRIGIGVFPQSGVIYRSYYTICKNILYFYGVAEGPQVGLGVFAYDGAQFNKVSTPAIDKILVDNPPVDIENIYFQGQEAVSIYSGSITATSNRWLMFFPKWKDWFEWNSDIFSPTNSGRYFIGSGASTHRIYSFPGTSTQSWIDDTTHFTEMLRFKIPTNGNHRKTMDYFGVVGDTEVGTTTSQLNVAFSDNDWQTTTAVSPIDLRSKDKLITRQGQFQDRGVVLTHTGNTSVRLQYAIAKIR